MRALSLIVTLALFAPQLGGCVAAALVPLAAGGAVAKRTVDAGSAGKKAKPARKVKPVVVVGRGSAAPQPQTFAATEPATQPAPAPLSQPPADPVLADPVLEVAPDFFAEPRKAKPQGVVPTARLAQDDAGYAEMTAYVLAAMGDGKPVAARTSVLLDQRSLASLPRMETCAEQRPALVIDLDRDAQPFDLDDAPTPEPGLAERLRTIRGRGVAVVWLASLPHSAENALLTIIKATGLDPLGLDHTLLLLEGETRKQQILNRAGDEWCVLALAGDRRSDFDEVFDYLRNPDGPVALALEQHIGAGWFLVPPPIR